MKCPIAIQVIAANEIPSGIFSTPVSVPTILETTYFDKTSTEGIATNDKILIHGNLLENMKTDVFVIESNKDPNGNLIAEQKLLKTNYFVEYEDGYWEGATISPVTTETGGATETTGTTGTTQTITYTGTTGEGTWNVKTVPASGSIVGSSATTTGNNTISGTTTITVNGFEVNGSLIGDIVGNDVSGTITKTENESATTGSFIGKIVSTTGSGELCATITGLQISGTIEGTIDGSNIAGIITYTANGEIVTENVTGEIWGTRGASGTFKGLIDETGTASICSTISRTANGVVVTESIIGTVGENLVTGNINRNVDGVLVSGTLDGDISHTTGSAAFVGLADEVLGDTGNSTQAGYYAAPVPALTDYAPMSSPSTLVGAGTSTLTNVAVIANNVLAMANMLMWGYSAPETGFDVSQSAQLPPDAGNSGEAAATFANCIVNIIADIPGVTTAAGLLATDLPVPHPETAINKAVSSVVKTLIGALGSVAGSVTDEVNDAINGIRKIEGLRKVIGSIEDLIHSLSKKCTLDPNSAEFIQNLAKIQTNIRKVEYTMKRIEAVSNAIKNVENNGLSFATAMGVLGSVNPDGVPRLLDASTLSEKDAESLQNIANLAKTVSTGITTYQDISALSSITSGFSSDPLGTINKLNDMSEKISSDVKTLDNISRSSKVNTVETVKADPTSATIDVAIIDNSSKTGTINPNTPLTSGIYVGLSTADSAAQAKADSMTLLSTDLTNYGTSTVTTTSAGSMIQTSAGTTYISTTGEKTFVPNTTK